MLVSCSACNSKYLVNSADLKPDGRTVQCAKCGHNWFQKTIIEEEEISSRSVHLSEKKNDKDNNNLKSNLPSTYIKKEKEFTILNSILVVIGLVIIISSFWFLKNNEINFIVLINFYLREFYFNLNMIINDLTKIIQHILN